MQAKIADSRKDFLHQLTTQLVCENQTIAVEDLSVKNMVKIDRWFPSSKRCGNCGHILQSLPLSVREWDCPSCGAHHDRDINAARNVLAVGHTVAVCGANVRLDSHEVKGQLRTTSNGKKQKPKS